MLKVLLFFILSCLGTFSFCQEALVSDYDFTNQLYTMGDVYKFVKSFKNDLSYSDVEIIVRYCHIYEINPLVILVKMELESGLLERHNKDRSEAFLRNRVMGYGMAKKFKRDGLKFYRYGGYQIQVFHAVKRMREFFDEYEYEKGKKKFIVDLDKYMPVSNAGTWALYRYTPFYGEHNVYNWDYNAVGNKVFPVKLKDYKEKIKNEKEKD